MPIMVIETIEGSPSRPPRERSPEELQAEIQVFIDAGFPRPRLP
jgi:hypothetical protein